jgi:hypothetical protein
MSASTRAAINDAITFFIGFFPVGLQEPTQPNNTNVDCKFQMAGRVAHKGRLADLRRVLPWRAAASQGPIWRAIGAGPRHVRFIPKADIGPRNL